MEMATQLKGRIMMALFPPNDLDHIARGGIGKLSCRAILFCHIEL